MKLKNQNKVLEQKVRQRTNQLEQIQEIAIQSLAALAETRDNETGDHIFRTKEYVQLLLAELKDDPKFKQQLTENNTEWIIKLAERKLGSNSFLRFARRIAYTHHEKWDGSGYPRGLQGEEIPVSGRLMAIVDIYDALISDRVYKSAYSHQKAVEIITQGDGRTEPQHFDPAVLEAFIRVQDQFEKIAQTFN